MEALKPLLEKISSENQTTNRILTDLTGFVKAQSQIKSGSGNNLGTALAGGAIGAGLVKDRPSFINRLDKSRDELNNLIDKKEVIRNKLIRTGVEIAVVDAPREISKQLKTVRFAQGMVDKGFPQFKKGADEAWSKAIFAQTAKDKSIKDVIRTMDDRIEDRKTLAEVDKKINRIKNPSLINKVQDKWNESTFGQKAQGVATAGAGLYAIGKTLSNIWMPGDGNIDTPANSAFKNMSSGVEGYKSPMNWLFAGAGQWGNIAGNWWAGRGVF